MAPSELSSMTSTISLNLTRSISVDFTACHKWYSYPDPPLQNDCLAAYNVLPTEDLPVSWYTGSIPSDIHNAYELPIIVKYGQYYFTLAFSMLPHHISVNPSSA